jgi:hypothetical protein
MHAKYKRVQSTQMYVNGRMWYKASFLGPWTRFTATGPVTVQGMHITVWTDNGDGPAAVSHTSRQVRAWPLLRRANQDASRLRN